MGPQVRMAGSLSINKRKTTETPETWTPGACGRRAAPQPGRPCDPQRDSTAPTASRPGPSRFCPMMAVWTWLRGG